MQVQGPPTVLAITAQRTHGRSLLELPLKTVMKIALETSSDTSEPDCPPLHGFLQCQAQTEALPPLNLVTQHNWF